MSFEHDPDLGKLKVVTEHIDQNKLLMMYRRIDETVGLKRAIPKIKNLGFNGEVEEPFEITISTPRILKVFRVQIELFCEISLIRYEYIAPEIEKNNLRVNIFQFFNESYPDFLEPIANEYLFERNYDPYKVCAQMFEAGMLVPLVELNPQR